MARRRKSKSSYRPRFKPNWRASFAWVKAIDGHIIKRSALGLAWIGCIAAIMIGLIWGLPRLESYAAAHAQVNPRDVQIRFTNLPPWVNGSLAEQLLRTAAMQIDDDTMRRDDLVAVREALLQTGWFDAVNQVRRTRGDLVEIDARFARPYTLIRDHAGYHLIDDQGKLLPMSYRSADVVPAAFDPQHGGASPIFGVHFPRPAVGQVWDGVDVVAGLKLLRLINQQAWRSQIAEIDVSQFMKDGPIRLRTESGAVIIWGGPPGEEAALELLAEGKIQRLNLLHQNHGSIDANRFRELDLTGERVTVAR